MTLSFFVILLLTSAAFTLSLALVFWHRRHEGRWGWPVIALSLASAVWAAGYAFEIEASSFTAKLFWAKVQYLGIVALSPAWLALALLHSGHASCLRWRRFGVFLVIPLLTLLAAFTNEHHHLVWSHVTSHPGQALPLELEYGLLFWIHVVYGVLLQLSGGIMLLLAYREFPAAYQRQAVALWLGAAVPPLAAAGLHWLGIFPPSANGIPITISAGVGVLAYLTMRLHLFDAVPVAYRTVVETMEDGVLVLDLQGRLLSLNPVAQRILGLSDGTGREAAQLTAERPELAIPLEAEIGSTGEIALTVEGENRFYDWRASELRNRHGQRVGRLVLFHDVTERKREEEETRLLLELVLHISTLTDFSQALHSALRLLVEHTGWIFGEAWVPDDRGEVLRHSGVSYYREEHHEQLGEFDRISREFTFAPGEGLPGRVWVSGELEWHQDVSQLSDEVYHRVHHAIKAGLKGAVGVPVLVEQEVVAVLVFYIAEPHIEDQHQVEVVTAVATQLGAVLRHMRYEETIRLHTAALEAAANAIVITDTEGTILWVNRAFTRITGYTPEEAIGQKPNILKSGRHSREFYRHIWETILSGQTWQGEVINRRKDGTLYVEEQTITPVRDEEGRITHFIAIKQDVTQRKQAEEALRESEARFRSLTQSTSDAIIVINSAGRILLWNKGAEGTFGYAEAEVLGQSVTMLMPERYREAHIRGMQRFLRTGESRIIGSTVEIEGLRKDGTEFPFAMSLSTWQVGDDRFFGAIIRDITAWREAEENLRQYAAELEKRNAELDAFAHTVAHDLKTPLTAVIGFSSLLRSRLGRLSPDKQREFLQAIEQNGIRMRNIVDELLLLSSVRGMETVELEPLDMGRLVAEARDRLVYMIDEYQAEIIVPPSWPEAMGYGPWVEEVWVNYISNAIKYGGRPPRVEVGATVEGDEVKFWVRDNGEGLTPEEQERLFTPFERLHQVSIKGHGLGLSIVRRIVERLGGHVGVESQPGEGSTFYFTLPAARRDG